MRHSSFSAAAAVLSAISLANAQLATDCDPLNGSCPSKPGFGTTAKYDFTKGKSDDWTNVEGTTVTYDPANGAQFVIKDINDSPKIQFNKYIMFGNVEFVAKSSSGNGVVSSFVFGSDDLDEMDWEWVGSSNSDVQTNFYGKNVTLPYNRGGNSTVSTPQDTWHTYAIDWTAERIMWSIDGNSVRTVPFADPLAKSGDLSIYPQTPMRAAFANWIACKELDGSNKGTCDWAGGQVDLSKGPFSMYVQSVTVTDYGCGGEYSFSDKSGSWQSIKSTANCDASRGTGNGDSSSTPSSSISSSSTTTSSSSSSSSLSLGASTTSSTSTGPTTTSSSTSAKPTTTNNATTTLAITTGSKSSSAPSSTSIVPKSAASGFKPFSFGVILLTLSFGYLLI